jgi:flagellar hook-length control protein FliK
MAPTAAIKHLEAGDTSVDPLGPAPVQMAGSVSQAANQPAVESSVPVTQAAPAVTAVVDQVRQALQTLARRDLADAVTLSPDRTMVVRLGPEVAPGVDIQIQATDDGFDISLVATDPLAREFLEVHQHRIRQAMSGQALAPLMDEVAVNTTGWSRMESTSPLQQATSDAGAASNSDNPGSGGRDSSGQDSSRRREPEQSAAAEESRGVTPSVSRQDDRVAEFRLSLGVWPNDAAQG